MHSCIQSCMHLCLLYLASGKGIATGQALFDWICHKGGLQGHQQPLHSFKGPPSNLRPHNSLMNCHSYCYALGYRVKSMGLSSIHRPYSSHMGSYAYCYIPGG